MRVRARCEGEREREKERETDREREGQRERGTERESCGGWSDVRDGEAVIYSREKERNVKRAFLTTTITTTTRTTSSAFQLEKKCSLAHNGMHVCGGSNGK